MNASDDDPATEAIYEVGTLASVLQLLKLPDGTVKALVEGAQRAIVVKYTDCSEYYEAEAMRSATRERVEAEALREVVRKMLVAMRLLHPGARVWRCWPAGGRRA